MYVFVDVFKDNCPQRDDHLFSTSTHNYISAISTAYKIIARKTGRFTFVQ